MPFTAVAEENGSVGSRALHFAAAGGAIDVAHYLLAKGCSAVATDAGMQWAELVRVILGSNGGFYVH